MAFAETCLASCSSSCACCVGGLSTAVMALSAVSSLTHPVLHEPPAGLCQEMGGHPWFSSRPSSPCIPLPPLWILARTPGHVRPCLHLLALLRRASPRAGV